jgi:hypothetical protein
MSADVTQAAIRALGANHSDDYVLQPEKHAGDLPAEAGALARVLSSEHVGGIIAAYRAADTAAIAHQGTYKQLGRQGLQAILVAAIFGGLSLWLLGLEGWFNPAELLQIFRGPPIVIDPQDPASKIPFDLRLQISLALYVVLAGQFLWISDGFLAAWRIRRQRLFDKWNEERGLAERHRRELFEAVTSAEEPVRDGEAPLLPLQLEYFRRFQLDVQSAYYRRRGDQHREAANGSKGLSGQVWRLANAPGTPVIVFVIVIGILFTPSLPASLVSLLLTGLSLAGVLGVGFSNYFAGVSALNQDRLNAARYYIAANNLNYLYDHRLEPARADAAAGDRAAVKKFVDDVNAQISTEHKEWYLLHDSDSQPDLRLVRPAAN